MDNPAVFYTKDWVTIVALFFGPIMAVVITLWYQRRAEKRAAKERLFVTLMAHRKSNPPMAEWVNALNLIDVVYADHPKVVGHWHTLYGVVNRHPMPQEEWNHTYIELLSEMAQALGYRTLRQTDIDKYYSPEALGKQQERIFEAQTELLRVLKATKSIGPFRNESEKSNP